MAEDSRDILMTMVLNTGKVIPVECQAVISSQDTMASGFAQGSSGPNYFSVEDFTFKVGLIPDKSANTQLAGAMKDQMEEHMKALQRQLVEKDPELAGMKLNAPKDASSFSRFMTGGRAAALRSRKMGQGQMYGADLEEIEITKILDASSLTLLQSCLTSVTFKSATLLKRRAVGQSQLSGFLRIDFTDVMLTEFNWSEDDLVKETFKFVCRQAVVQYAVESASGTLNPQATRKWGILNLAGSGG